MKTIFIVDVVIVGSNSKIIMFFINLNYIKLFHFDISINHFK